jgi:hypothetical protein
VGEIHDAHIRSDAQHDSLAQRNRVVERAVVGHENDDWRLLCTAGIGRAFWPWHRDEHQHEERGASLFEPRGRAIRVGAIYRQTR